MGIKQSARASVQEKRLKIGWPESGNLGDLETSLSALGPLNIIEPWNKHVHYRIGRQSKLYLLCNAFSGNITLNNVNLRVN